MVSPPAGAPGRRLKVHVDNMRVLGSTFEVDAASFANAAQRFPAAAAIDLTIGYDGEDLAARLGEAEVLFAWQFPRRELAALAPRLRWIQLMGAGLDHLLPLDWLPPGVRLATAAGAHHDKAGEVLAMAVLMLNNAIPAFATTQRAGRWAPVFTGQVRGKTVLIVGVGATGGGCARACKALGMHVVGVRPSRRPHPDVDEMLGIEGLRAALARADFVVVTVPLTALNHGFIGRAELACCKPGAGLVSIARHGVIDAAAMMDALDSGHLSGAVYDLEDPSQVPADPRLFATPNLLIVPHCLTNDPATFRDNMLAVFLANVTADLAGVPLPTQVDPAREY